MTRLEVRTAAHAASLFPLLHRSPVLDTIIWEGPDDEASFVAAFAEHGERTRKGEAHEFTIVADDGTPVGCLSVRPSETPGRGDLGILVTAPHQRRGHARRAVEAALAYAFGRLGWVKAEAGVFVGNEPSRRLFEGLGFVLEGTVQRRILKRGTYRDEWLFGLLRESWDARPGPPSVTPAR